MFQTRLTEEEARMVKRRAAYYGITRSELARFLLLELEVAMLMRKNGHCRELGVTEARP